MRIGEVAERAGLRRSAIRYYEEIGLLPEPERISGQRIYDVSVLRRLALIDVSQRAGLSLDEIGELLEAGSEPISPRMQELAAKKLPEVEALLRRAEAMRAWLEAAKACACETIDECALFDPERGNSLPAVERITSPAPPSSARRLAPAGQRLPKALSTS